MTANPTATEAPSTEQYLEGLAARLRGPSDQRIPHLSVILRLAQVIFPRPVVYADCVLRSSSHHESDGP